MKIGTVTYHRANNYGAVLQAYGLYKYLQKKGVDVEVIDYWPEHHKKVYSAWNWDQSEFTSYSLSQKILYSVKRIIVFFKTLVRNKNFDSFRGNYLKISKGTKNYYDGVFYGSDTIWNRWNLNNLHTGFDDVMWGNDVIKSTYKFSYAPSMGNVIDTKETKEYCNTMLPNFSMISVRESNLQEKLTEWGTSGVQKVIDPTMLLKKEEWEDITPSLDLSNDYILCYNLEHSVIIDNIAKKMSLKHNLKVVYLTSTITKSFSKYVKDTAGPSEFLSLFKNAKYIVTSSFHGVVFSIIFEKSFCFNSNTETERITSLLDSAGLSDRFIKDDSIHIFEKRIEFDDVRERLEPIKEQSYAYIRDCLNILEK